MRPVGEIHATGHAADGRLREVERAVDDDLELDRARAEAHAAHAALAAVGALDELGPEQLLDAAGAPAQLLARERDAVERAQWNAQPPHTWIICPVMKDARSEARNATVSARSSAVPRRLSDCCSITKRE